MTVSDMYPTIRNKSGSFRTLLYLENPNKLVSIRTFSHRCIARQALLSHFGGFKDGLETKSHQFPDLFSLTLPFVNDTPSFSLKFSIGNALLVVIARSRKASWPGLRGRLRGLCGATPLGGPARRAGGRSFFFPGAEEVVFVAQTEEVLV